MFHQADDVFTIQESGKELVRVTPDGEIQIADGLTQDELRAVIRHLAWAIAKPALDAAHALPETPIEVREETVN